MLGYFYLLFENLLIETIGTYLKPLFSKEIVEQITGKPCIDSKGPDDLENISALPAVDCQSHYLY